jgi:hypothetical protein
VLLQMFMGEKFGRDPIWEGHLATEIGQAEIAVDAVLHDDWPNRRKSGQRRLCPKGFRGCPPPKSRWRRPRRPGSASEAASRYSRFWESLGAEQKKNATTIAALSRSRGTASNSDGPTGMLRNEVRGLSSPYLALGGLRFRWRAPTGRQHGRRTAARDGLDLRRRPGNGT